MGAVVFCWRWVFIGLIPSERFPPRLAEALRFVPAAVLSALVLPEFFARHGTILISLTNHRLLAGMLGLVVAWRTKHLLAPLVVGMMALWLLDAWLPLK